jgi:hypothetical protein
MAMAPAFAREAGLPSASEALQQEGKDAPQESGAGLTVCRRMAPQARSMEQMTSGGVAMQNLPQE